MQDAQNDNLNAMAERLSPARPSCGHEAARRGSRRRARGIACGMLAVSSWLALAGTAPAVPATRPAVEPETIVRLRANTLVTADEVTLGDVADLTGEGAGLIAPWPISAAPRVGSSGVVDFSHIQRVLSRRGVNLSNWVFRGATHCIVTRPTSSVPAEPKSEASAMAPAGRTFRTPATRPGASAEGSVQSVGVAPRTLEAAIHEHIRGRLVGASGILSIRFSPNTERLLTLSADNYQFHIVDRGERTLGVVPLEVTILENGKTTQVAQVLCEASLRRQVVVAARNLNRGEVLSAADLGVEERSFERLDDIGLVDAAPLVNQRARRMVRQGEPIDTHDIEPVPLVARNDLVGVSVRRNGLVITATARAMASGCYGETIALRSELSKETFMGIVTGPKAVELTSAKPEPAVAMAKGGR